MRNKELIAKQKAFLNKLEKILKDDTIEHRGLGRFDADWWFDLTPNDEPLMNLSIGDELKKGLDYGEPVRAFEVETPGDYHLIVRLKIRNIKFCLYRIEDDVKWVYGDVDNYEDLDERNRMQEAADKLKTYLEDDLKKAGLKTEFNSWQEYSKRG